MANDLIVCPLLESYIEAACEGIDVSGVPEAPARLGSKNCRAVVRRRSEILIYGALNIFLPHECEIDGGTAAGSEFRRFGAVSSAGDVNRFNETLRKHEEFFTNELSRRGRVAVRSSSSALDEFALILDHGCPESEPCLDVMSSANNVGLFVSSMAARAPKPLRLAVYEMLLTVKPAVYKSRRQLDRTLS